MTTKKSILLAVLVVVLLTFSVSGTIAWLTTSTKPIENTFTPATVDTVIIEGFNGTAKSSIQVENKREPATNVPVYVRVALVANWVKDGKIVAPASITVDHDEDNWTKSGEYYYYNSKLAVGDRTPNLLETAIEQLSPLPEGVPVGSSLQIVVLHQSIQADGGAKDAINAWNN